MYHILLTGNTAWGMFNFRRDLLQLLVLKGHKVTVVAPPDKKFEEKIIRLGCCFIPVSIDAKGTNPLSDIFLIRKYYKIYRSEAPDFIFHYTIKPNIYGTIAAGCARIPSIAIVTGLGYTFINKGIISHIANLLYSIAFKVSKEVWFLNEDDRNLFTRRRIVKKEKSFVLKGEGINLELFSGSLLTNSRVSFLLASRMLWDKGIGEYVDAARVIKKSHPEVQFKLLGPHSVENPKAIPERQINEWQKEGVITYLGATDNIKTFINDASAIVLPSYREGMPRILLEAAAMERPVIASNCVGCRDVVIDNVTGFLCEPKNTEVLASAMLKIISLDKRDLEDMGRKGRALVKKEFSNEVVLERYLEILKNLDQ